MMGLSHPAYAEGFPASEVEELLAMGAQVATILPPDGWSFLAHASMRGNVPAARTLLQHGADPEGNPLRRAIPLHVAAVNGHVEVLKVLLDAGADVNSRDTHGNSALFRVLTLNVSRRSSVPELLIEAGIDTTLRNNSGATAQDEWERHMRVLTQPMSWPGRTAADEAREHQELMADDRRVRAILGTA
jgi:ankyrin repeat protein